VYQRVFDLQDMARKTNNTKITLHKAIYFCSIIGTYLFSKQDRHCPFCGALDVSKIADKLFFLKLLRCNQCEIMFRFPKDKSTSGAIQDYRLNGEFKVSHLPQSEELTRLKLKKFKGSIYDISDKLGLIKKYLAGGEMLDYGSSWGYNLWQFLEEGFSGLGFEISAKRAAFGEKSLGLRIIHDPAALDTLESHFDIVFANQVLEHVQDPKKELNRVYHILKDGGFLVIFVPDGTNLAQEKWKNIYAFGERHALAFTAEFFEKNFPSLGFNILEIKKIKMKEHEIMVIARKQRY
jgi:SAM-dependent methyltransferase